MTPGVESALFANFSQISTPTGASAAGHEPPAKPSRTPSPFYADPTASPATRFSRREDLHTHVPHRVNRKHSRSAARRPHSDSPLGRQWHIESNPHCNGGLNNAVRSVEGKLRRKLWVGTLGANTDSFKDPLKRSIDRRMLEEYESLPIWIPDDEFSAYYDMFCHQVLWPCLHYVIPDAPKTKYFYESSSFKQYVAVSQRFADAITAVYQEGDISTLPPFLKSYSY